MKKNIIKLVTFFLMSLLFTSCNYSTNSQENKSLEENKKEEKKLEIEAYAYEMFAKASKKKINNISLNCVSFFPFDNDYIGSVDVGSNDYYIWLSDGTFYVTGTINNLTIIESEQRATVNCNK